MDALRGPLGIPGLAYVVDLPGFEGPDHVTLRHPFSHTSAREVGREYVYSSSRYARVGDLLQAATGRRFEALLRRGVARRWATTRRLPGGQRRWWGD